jgi:hypothetical protein
VRAEGLGNVATYAKVAKVMHRISPLEFSFNWLLSGVETFKGKPIVNFFFFPVLSFCVLKQNRKLEISPLN